MAPNTASLTRRLWLWLVPAVHRPPAHHPIGPWTWPCKKGDARRQQVTGRRDRCGKPRKCRRRKRSATEALELSKGREVQYAAGLALGFFRGMFSIRGARRRFEKALPGRCFCQIYLCAAFSDPGKHWK